MPPDPQPMWEYISISKVFPGVVANDKVHLTLRGGSIHGLLGENGCGKSTLIKTMAGIQQPDSGQIRHKGTPVSVTSPQMARRLGVATVFQEFSIVPSLSVGENIFMGRLPRTRAGLINWPHLHAAAAQVLARMGVDIPTTAICDTLSVGQQQLVEIAKAVSMDARMIILDEPTAALGEDEIEQLHRLLRRMRDDGCAVLYVSHRLDEVERIVDEVTILRGGRVVAEAGTTDINVADIVAAMVGSAVSEHYPKERNATKRVVLRARGLATANGLHDAAFDLHAGEVLGLGGVLGSGRTELARALFGVDRLTGGQLTLNGTPLRLRNERDAIRAGLALVPENRKTDGLFFNFRAGGNVTAAALPALTRAGFLDLAREESGTGALIDALEVTPTAAQKTVNFLSGGNQQKIVIARWLFSGADILILDEPTQGIDIGAKIAVYKLINQLTRAGKSVILISSDHDELLAMSDRVAVLNHGRVSEVTDAATLSHGDLVCAATPSKFPNPEMQYEAHI